MSDKNDEVLYEASDGVAVLTLNRPDRMNAWTPALGDMYYDCLARASRDPDVKVMVVTGAGRAFCAGGDTELLSDITGSTDGPLRGKHAAAETRAIPKPVVAAINGAAVGVGLIYALHADIRFAAENIKLGTGYSKIGLPAEDGMSWLLQRMIGTPAAMELLLSGRLMVADEAKARGLVTDVFPRANFLADVLKYAREIATTCSPRAMALIKRQVYSDGGHSFETALTDAQLLTARALSFPDFAEGLKAFADKRAPAFPGLSTGNLVDPLF